MELRKYYDPLDREWVAGWIDSEEVATAFCGLNRVTDQVFEGWLAAQDQLQFVLVNENNEPVAYGEIWVEEESRDVEIAHLLVTNEARGEGFGSEMMRKLVEYATAKLKQTQRILARNEPENEVAAAALQKALFVRMEPVPEDWSDEFDWYWRDLAR